MVNHNYEIAKKHYSYAMLGNQLDAAMHELFAQAVVPETATEAEHDQYKPLLSESTDFAQLSN
jgi:hypothetical protein